MNTFTSHGVKDMKKVSDRWGISDEVIVPEGRAAPRHIYWVTSERLFDEADKYNRPVPERPHYIAMPRVPPPMVSRRKFSRTFIVRVIKNMNRW